MEVEQERSGPAAQVGKTPGSQVLSQTGLGYSQAEDHAGEDQPDGLAGKRRETVLKREQAGGWQDEQEDQGAEFQGNGFGGPEEHGKQDQAQSALGLRVEGFQGGPKAERER